MDFIEKTTKKGTKYNILDLKSCKIIHLKYGYGVIKFRISDWKKLNLQKGKNRYFISIDDKDIFGKKTKKKHTSLDNAIDYLEEMKEIVTKNY